jgi:hypothetical protein
MVSSVASLSANRVPVKFYILITVTKAVNDVTPCSLATEMYRHSEKSDVCIIRVGRLLTIFIYT